jgi:hypothetical protein
MLHGFWGAPGRAWAVFLTGLCAASVAGASPPGCKVGDCGLRQAAPFAHIVVARLSHVVTDDAMRRLYRWGKAGVWKHLPDDEADYLARNRVLVLPADDKGTPLMLHMSHEEYRRLVFHEGDLVRYTPRLAGLPHPSGPAPSIYSTLSGCIMVLCRAEDSACAAHYRTGVFRHADGVQIDPRTQQPLPGGVTIDPLSLLPKPAPAKAPNN